MEKIKEAWERSKELIFGENPAGEKKVYFVLIKAKEDHYNEVCWYYNQQIQNLPIHEGIESWKKGKKITASHSEEEFKKIIRWLFS